VPPRPQDSSKTTSLSLISDEKAQTLDEVYEHEWRHGLYEAARGRIRRKVSPLKHQIYDVHIIREWPVENVAKPLSVTPNQV
jgi:hypothetical protein